MSVPVSQPNFKTTTQLPQAVFLIAHFFHYDRKSFL